jgi:hypothetical protein
MKLSPAALALLLLSHSFVWAQQPTIPPRAVGGVTPATTLETPVPAAPERTSTDFTQPSLSLPTITPELWLYSQEWRRHDDPAQAVRRKAEARTAQRMERLEAMRWYGFSNIRPQASVTPFMSTYSPAWIGNGYDRYDWVNGRYAPTVVRIETYGNTTVTR